MKAGEIELRICDDPDDRSIVDVSFNESEIDIEVASSSKIHVLPLRVVKKRSQEVTRDSSCCHSNYLALVVQRTLLSSLLPMESNATDSSDGVAYNFSRSYENSIEAVSLINLQPVSTSSSNSSLSAIVEPNFHSNSRPFETQEASGRTETVDSKTIDDKNIGSDVHIEVGNDEPEKIGSTDVECLGLVIDKEFTASEIENDAASSQLRTNDLVDFSHLRKTGVVDSDDEDDSSFSDSKQKIAGSFRTPLGGIVLKLSFADGLLVTSCW